MKQILLDPTAEGGSTSVSPGEAGAGAAAASSGISTHSNEFERAVSYLPEPDSHVPVVDPLFDIATARKFRIKKPELSTPETDPTSKAVSVRINYEALEELVSTDGTRFAPPYLYRPRPFQLVGDDGKVGQKHQFAQRDLNRQLIAAGLARKGQTLSAKEILTALPGLEGKEVYVKLSTSTSSKRDAEGNFFINQNMAFAPVGESGNGTAEAGGSSGGSPVPNY